MRSRRDFLHVLGVAGITSVAFGTEPPSGADSQENPTCLVPETARFFLDTILPELVGIANEFRIHEYLQEGEITEDVLSFSYGLAVLSLDKPARAWSPKIKERSLFYTYVLCPIRSLGAILPLPEKAPERLEQMRHVRPRLARGAFRCLVVKLSLNRTVLQLTPEQVRKQEKLPPISELFDSKILERIEPEK